MSSLHPTNVRFSMEEFSRHGSLAGPHKDGWGIAWYEDEDVRLIKEPIAATDSPSLRFIQDHPFHSNTVLSHIRKATQGHHTLANSQPFARELGGRMHLFAHNGDLDSANLCNTFRLGAYHPVGETDSEYAFCALLERLSWIWQAPKQTPSIELRLAVVTEFAAKLRALGPANFLYSDDDALFIHAHKRTHTDGIRPPGLNVLSRACAASSGVFAAEGLRLQASAPSQEVFLAASVPLTTLEVWQPLAAGEILAIQSGRIVARSGGSGE